MEEITALEKQIKDIENHLKQLEEQLVAETIRGKQRIAEYKSQIKELKKEVKS